MPAALLNPRVRADLGRAGARDAEAPYQVTVTAFEQIVVLPASHTW